MAPVHSKPKRKADSGTHDPARTLSKKRQAAQQKRHRTQSVPGAFPSSFAHDGSNRSAHSVVASFKAKSPRKADRSKSKSRKQRHAAPPTPAPIRPPKCQRVSLRFSFGGPHNAQPMKRGRTRGRSRGEDEGDQLTPTTPRTTTPGGFLPTTPTRDEPALRKSFSELVVTPTAHNLTGPLQRQPCSPITTSTSPPREPARPPDPSVFTRPTRKRQGYGFSYSESLWLDSDEYPDTECDWDLTDDKSSAQPSPHTSPEQSAQALDSYSSSDDVVVMRDVGSFHLARPQRTLPCTRATREDTIRLKTSAKALFKWDESEDVYSGLVERLERMVYAAIARRRVDKTAPAPDVVACAVRLRDFLLKVKGERMETGEPRRFVEHEGEWARWLVEASRTGVMHLKTRGCGCRPDWEED